MKTSRHILISGASGGLGRALALAYAGPGAALSLWGRRFDALEKTAGLCRARGAEVELQYCDLRDRAELKTRLLACDAARPLDMLILCAGVTSGRQADGRAEAAEDAVRTVEVNAVSSIFMAALILERMEERGSGQIVFISSIASLAPLPGSPAYCASKAAISAYARSLQAAKTPVRISLVQPGYIDTPMTRRLAGNTAAPWPADKAAAHIRKKLEEGKDLLSFPRHLAFGAFCLGLLAHIPLISPLAAYLARRFSYTVQPDRESPDYQGEADAPDSSDA